MIDQVTPFGSSNGRRNKFIVGMIITYLFNPIILHRVHQTWRAYRLEPWARKHQDGATQNVTTTHY